MHGGAIDGASLVVHLVMLCVRLPFTSRGIQSDAGDFMSAGAIERGGVKGVRLKETPELVKIMRE